MKIAESDKKEFFYDEKTGDIYSLPKRGPRPLPLPLVSLNLPASKKLIRKTCTCTSGLLTLTLVFEKVNVVINLDTEEVNIS
ncbi:hypothetical protein J7J13_01955 [bacterium]|nr:hypothetical protein [bacterium]